VEFLLTKDGNWNMVGVNNGTMMHRAAWDGDLPTIERLVAKGADVNDRNNPFVATPIGWAHYNHQMAVVQWMIAHCALDIHEAVCFDLREQVDTRLREQPDAVNKRIDHLTIPSATPLHCAARYDCAELAELLIQRGAKPNSLAGNGQTPLDTANAGNGARVASVLIRHGGKTAATL
jgi:ankyrin repeat protein